MILNPINKDMIVHSSIELQPTINYVSASNDCHFLNRLDISSAGVYGDLKAESLNIRQASSERTDRLYNVNDAFLSDGDYNLVEKLKIAKDLETELDTTLQDFIDNLDTSSLTTQEAIEMFVIYTGAVAKVKKDNFANQGLKKINYDSSFKVERIEKKFIIDNPSYLKKSAVLNMFNYYRENMSHNNFFDLYWGFKNYNSLNFFNLYDDINSNFKNNITHKNCVIYPNLYVNGKSTYKFNADEYSFSFYVNPKRSVSSSFHYNPGCVLNIPGVISIYLVKGTSLNENNETNKFRIFCELGDNSYNSINTNFANFDIDDTGKQTNNFSFLSSDNLLKLNNWHNVCISYKINNVNSSNKSNISLYVDGVLIEEFVFNSNIHNVTQNSAIFIGNKTTLLENEISDFVLHAFSKDNQNLDDNEGPYIKKHILFGSEVDSVLNSGSDSNKTYLFKNKLNEIENSYVLESTSQSFNGELCDIRIYNEYFDSEKASNIYASGIPDLQKEIDEFNLSFYLPVYYRSQKVKKEGLVNLSAPYQVYDDSIEGVGLVNVDDNLQGNYIFTYTNGNENQVETLEFKVKTENISYNFPVNPFFLNFTGGTDVSVEHFLREFVKQTQPNVVIGGSIKSDTYQDCFLGKPNAILNDIVFNDLTKKGHTPFSLYEKIVKTLTLDDLNNINIDYQENNISYRNYMILPNDNGIQRQYYNQKVFNYNDGDFLDSHKNELDEISFDFVSLKNIDKSHSLNNSIPKTSMLISDNFSIDGETIEENERKPYRFNNKILSLLSSNGTNRSLDPSFKERCDKIKNISLGNFHNLENSSYFHDYDLAGISNSSIFRNTGIIPDTRIEFISNNTGFYKTLSNPSQRSYYSSHDNTISETEVYDFKQIEENSQIVYKKILMPLEQLEKDFNENCSTIFSISTQLFNKKIKRETFEIKDVDLSMSSGLSMTFKDSNLGSLYRSDSLTPHAEWNTSGNILYNEGIVTLTHPSMFNFGKTNFKINCSTHTDLNVFELNLPAHRGETNKSNNLSYIDNLRLDKSAFNADEDFVYITDIDLHDENLNVVASVKLAQPFAKKDSDNVLFRVKMDF